MSGSHLGELAALATACFWTVTALAFESAARRMGSLALNLIRLVLAFLFLAVFTFAMRGMPLPLDASAHAWLWLSLSGIVGFVLGDLFLFRAFADIGSRVSMLIMAAVPPLTAVISWLLMGEVLSRRDLAGMALTVGGIALVVLDRRPGGGSVRFSRPLAGVLLAFGGALGQAGGLVLSKFGMGDYDAFAATQVRIIAGIAGFALLFFLRQAWRRLGPALRDRRAMGPTLLGAFFGPFLGVSFSLLAVQHTATGVAATIMALVPVLIILPSALLFGERVTFREVAGAVIAVSGVALLFL